VRDLWATVRKRGKTYRIDYYDPNGKRIRRSFKKEKDAEAEPCKRVSLKTECHATLKDVQELLGHKTMTMTL
jgi:hypothetical protein